MDTEHMPSTQLTEADLTDVAIGILTLMVKAGLAASNGEARRLVVQGGVLAEQCFVTNDEDVEHFGSEQGCKTVARIYYEAICAYFEIGRAHV